MADARRVPVAELRRIITDASELAKGTQVADSGALSHLARFEHRLFAEARGSGKSSYRVSIELAERDADVKGRCTCMAARSRPFCKHASALLVSWSRAPESFAVSEEAPAEISAGGSRKKRVKQGKRDAKALMKTGVDQVDTLVRELAVAGIAAVSQERVDEIRALGETLRENRLRRLSARVLEVADLLGRATGGEVDESDYAGVLADMLLTAAKIGRHLGGETLDDRYVEELIGRTWRKNDRRPVSGLELVEYAFGSRVTSDGYVVRESRFVDAATGEHYCEKQILPIAMDKRTTPKQSHAGSVLTTTGGIYPGFAPLRLHIEDATPRPLSPETLEAVVAAGARDVSSAVEAFQEYRRDVFAPDAMPVALAADTVLATDGRLRVVDAQGAALHLPQGVGFEEPLGDALRHAELLAFVGEIVSDAALPTLCPYAAIVRRDGKPSLERLLDANQSIEIRLAAGTWADSARRAGLSSVAISLGEVREGLAQAMTAGLAGFGDRAAQPHATRLEDLGLGKQAALLSKLAAEADPAERVGDFVKVYQLLELAMIKLAGASHVDRSELERVPTFRSVFVRPQSERLSPEEAAARRARGELNEYEAAVHLCAHYESLRADDLVGDPMIWADGNARPYVVGALAERGDEALEAAFRMLDSAVGRAAHLTALQIVEQQGGEPAADALEKLSKAAFKAAGRTIGDHWRVYDTSLSGLIADAVVRMRQGSPTRFARRRIEERDEELAEARAILLSAGDKSDRAKGAWRLRKLGARDAIPALRSAYRGDPTVEVRSAAALALGALGDTGVLNGLVDSFTRRRESEEGKVAASVLGLMGDVRGLSPLLDACREAWKPAVVGEALAGFGRLGLELALDRAATSPELLKRKPILNLAEQCRPEELTALLLDRLGRAEEDFATLPALLKVAAVHKPTGREVASRVVELTGGVEDKDAKAANRAAKRLLK